MSELNFFQMYSQAENHVTNNVTLMLRHLYRESASKLQYVFEACLSESDDFSIGPSFSQQVKGSDSVPDAVIQQMGFQIIVEVKPDSGWNKDQIARHLKTSKNMNFSGKKLVLLLSKNEDPDIEGLKRKAYKSNIALTSITFAQLLSYVDSPEIVAAHETDLAEIISDFRAFLSAEGLLPDPYLMFAFGCSNTLDWNMKNAMYYDYVSRPTKSRVLNAFYANREIHAVGKSLASFTGYSSQPKKLIKEFNVSSMTDEQVRNKIHAAMKSEGFEQKEDLRFYIYDSSSLVETSYTKETPYGFFQGTWLRIEKELSGVDVNNVKAIAEALKDKSFGKDRGFG